MDQSTAIYRKLIILMMQSKRQINIVTEKWGMTPVQGMLLVLFEPQETKSMQELSVSMGCDASNITGLVDRMEAQDLILRTVDPQDRRVKMIRLSPKGLDCRTKVLNGLALAETADTRKLSTDELAALSKIIDKLLK